MIRFHTVQHHVEPVSYAPDSMVSVQRTEEASLGVLPPLNLVANIYSVHEAHNRARVDFSSPEGAHALDSFRHEGQQISVLAESLKSGVVTSSVGALGGCAVGWWCGLGLLMPALAGGALVGLCTAAWQAWHLSRAQARDDALTNISRWAAKWLGSGKRFNQSQLARFNELEQQCQHAGSDIILVFVRLKEALRAQGSIG